MDFTVCLRRIARLCPHSDLVGVREFWKAEQGWSATLNDLPLSCHIDPPKTIVANVIQAGGTMLNLKLEDRRNGHIHYLDYSARELQAQPLA